MYQLINKNCHDCNNRFILPYNMLINIGKFDFKLNISLIDNNINNFDDFFLLTNELISEIDIKCIINFLHQ